MCRASLEVTVLLVSPTEESLFNAAPGLCRVEIRRKVVIFLLVNVLG